MTPTELEALSREAAACLPEMPEFSRGFHYVESALTGQRKEWLAESTEACTEIMVRELPIAVAKRVLEQAALLVVDGMEGMLAFRVAVLKALCALKGS